WNGGSAIALDGVRAHPEIILMEAPGDCAVVNRAATGLVAVALSWDRCRARPRIGPPRHRLALRIRTQVLTLEVAQLILGSEVLGAQPRAALERDHFHAGLAKLGRQNATGGASADDDDIGLFCCHGSGPPRWSLALQADQHTAREGLLARHVGR